MLCTFCNGPTHVINSRLQRRINNVWRRRRCQNCSLSFSTIEQVDYEKSWIVLSNGGKKEPFVREKLIVSLYESLRHRDTALNDALGITQTVMSQLNSSIEHTGLKASEIARHCHTALKRFDSAAATMYRAYHMSR